MAAWIGTCGWSYPHWRGTFYPSDLPKRRWLAFAAERLDAIEINATFYGSMRHPRALSRWRSDVEEVRPGGEFRFTIKGSRFVTHVRRLREPAVPLANFFSTGVLLLGDALGPILWQFPPTLALDEDLLERFLEALPRTAAGAQRLADQRDDRFRDRGPCTLGPGMTPKSRLLYALEPRHESFGSDRFLYMCERNAVAVVAADLRGGVRLDVVTAGHAYGRLHGSGQKHTSQYSDAELEAWANRIRSWLSRGIREAYVLFNNDAHGYAPRDALRLKQIVRHHALQPSPLVS